MKDTPLKKKAVIYSRLSTKNKIGLSVQNQIKKCRAYAKEHNYKVVATFKDSCSSIAPVRPGFEEMLNFVRSNNISVLVVTDVSRLSRDFTGLASGFQIASPSTQNHND